MIERERVHEEEKEQCVSVWKRERERGTRFKGLLMHLHVFSVVTRVRRHEEEFFSARDIKAKNRERERERSKEKGGND